MVSGLVTSPELQERICLEEARPILMASKLLMSIMRFLGSGRWEGAGAGRVGRSGLRLDVLGERLGGGVRLDGSVALGLNLLLGLLALDGLVVGLAVGGPHAREVDAELLGGPEQVVVLLAQLGLLALLGDDVDVERQRLHLLEQDLEGLGDAR